MLSPQYQRFEQNQLCDDPINFDTSIQVESPLQKHNYQKRQTMFFENSGPMSRTENFKNFQLSNKLIFSPDAGSPNQIRKSYVSAKNPSHRVLRMNKCNKLHKSKSIIQATNISQNKVRLRRRSGIEQLSQKQVRLNILYPTTQVAQHQQLKEVKRNDMRKKSIFKRMSSILIKHSNNLKSQNSLVIQSTKPSDEVNNKFDEQQPAVLIRQFQQQLGELKESEELLQNMQNSEKLIQLQEELKRYSQSLNTSPVMKRIAKKPISDQFLDQQKVVLDVTKKNRKTFTSIKNYINEKQPFNLTKTQGFIQSQINCQYQKLASLTETDSSSPIKMKASVTARNNDQRKSFSYLPEIKEIQTQRAQLNKKNIDKVRNIYMLSPTKKKITLDKIKL